MTAKKQTAIRGIIGGLGPLSHTEFESRRLIRICLLVRRRFL